MFRPTEAFGTPAAMSASPSPPALFADVSCSQCGRGFGPGPHGFSSCASHRRRVVTEFDRKPIAYRRFDWNAFIDGGPDGVTGYGATRWRALKDLAKILSACRRMAVL